MNNLYGHCGTVGMVVYHNSQYQKFRFLRGGWITQGLTIVVSAFLLNISYYITGQTIYIGLISVKDVIKANHINNPKKISQKNLIHWAQQMSEV